MKKTIISLIMLSVFVISGRASAISFRFEEGQKLKEQAYAYEKANNEMREATITERIDGTFFMGYVIGTADALSMTEVICLSKDVKGEQLYSMVGKYIKNNPEKWHLSGIEIVTNALLPTFPCKSKAK